MGDLTELNSSMPIKIAGADSTGLETNFVNASPNGDLQTNDISNNGGDFAAITVGTSAVEAKAGASPLANRKLLSVYHMGSGKLYWGLANTVTSANGTEIFKNEKVVFGVGPNTHVWLIASTAGNDIRVVEFA